MVYLVDAGATAASPVQAFRQAAKIEGNILFRGPDGARFKLSYLPNGTLSALFYSQAGVSGATMQRLP